MLIFPSFITAKNCDKLLPILDSVISSDTDTIAVTAKHTKFVDPFSLCLLAACCDKLQQQDRHLNILELSPEMQSYWVRMDLFKQCHQEEPDLQRNDQRGSLLEIQCLQGRQDVGQVADKISRAIAGQTPECREESQPDEMTGFLPHELVEYNLRYIFNELLENSLTHGHRHRHRHGYNNSKVWVACQYYRSKDTIRIGIVDTGCGFRQSLQNQNPMPQTDEAAIRLALQPRISCNRDVDIMDDSYNEGIGLTVVQRMVKDVGGTMVLLSGQSVLEITLDELAKPLPDTGWQGVGIAIEVKRSELKERLVRDVIGELRSETTPPQSDIDIQFV